MDIKGSRTLIPFIGFDGNIGPDKWLYPSRLRGKLINKHLQKSEEKSEWSLSGQNCDPEYNIVAVEFKG